MPQCPDCHAVVDDEAFFCDQCGFQLRPKPGTQGVVATAAPEIQAAVAGEEQRHASALPGSTRGACLACGYINPRGEIFCANCGVQLSSEQDISESFSKSFMEASPLAEAVDLLPGTDVKSCPTCGTENLASETYCKICGFWLTATVLPAAPAAKPEPRQTFVQAYVSLPDQPLDSHLEPPVAPAALPPIETAPSISIIGRLFSTTTAASLSLPAKGEIILGRRDPDRAIYPDVDLSDQGTVSNSVSRQHARLLVQENQIYVEDLNSTNSTYLNRQKLQPGQRYLLKDGDELRLGGVALVYYSK